MRSFFVEANGLHSLSQHGPMSRRKLLRRFALLGLAATSSSALLSACNVERSRDREEEVAAAEEDDDPDGSEESRSFPELEVEEINGVDLAVWDSGGDGDPVVFIHGAAGDEVMPLLIEPALTEQFRLIHYNRRGWGKSPQSEHPTTMEERAADCRAVMEHFGIERAHIEGLSAGGNIAIQFAVDYPDAVQSLALLEPALPSVLFNADQFLGVFAEVAANFEEGDTETAVELFALEVIGEDYLTQFEQNAPEGAVERWAGELETLFLYDGPGDDGWEFTEEMAEQITQPVLNMTGADAEPYWEDVHERIAEMLPHAETVVLPNAPHAMTGANPDGTAQQLAAFFARHPL